MSLLDIFKKEQKEDKFVSLLIEQAETTVAGLQLLETLITRPNKESIEQMQAKEYEGDEVRRILIDELHNTFITPFDREDIFNLSLNIDEMLDYALTTLEEMRY